MPGISITAPVVEIVEDALLVPQFLLAHRSNILQATDFAVVTGIGTPRQHVARHEQETGNGRGGLRDAAGIEGNGTDEEDEGQYLTGHKEAAT